MRVAVLVTSGFPDVKEGIELYCGNKLVEIR